MFYQGRLQPLRTGTELSADASLPVSCCEFVKLKRAGVTTQEALVLMLDEGLWAPDPSYLLLPAGPIQRVPHAAPVVRPPCGPAPDPASGPAPDPAPVVRSLVRPLWSQYLPVFWLLSWRSGSSINGLLCPVANKRSDLVLSSLRHSVKMHYSYSALIHVMHTNLGSKAYSEPVNNK